MWCRSSSFYPNRCLICVLFFFFFRDVSGRLRVFHMVMFSFIKYLSVCSPQVSAADCVPGNQLWAAASGGI